MLGPVLVVMVDPEMGMVMDMERGLLNQDMVTAMVDTLEDPVEDSQEVIVVPVLDTLVATMATQEVMVDPEGDMVMDMERGLLNQDMVIAMVDTLEDPVEGSQEVMVVPMLDTPEALVATQEVMVDPEVDMVMDTERGLLSQDMVTAMVDTLEDPMEDSQEVIVVPVLDTLVAIMATQEVMVDPEVDMVMDMERGLLNQDMVTAMVDSLEDPMEDSQEVMLVQVLDTLGATVATQVAMVDPEVDMVMDTERGLLSKDIETAMADILVGMVDTSVVMVAALLDIIKSIAIQSTTKFKFLCIFSSPLKSI